MARCRIALLDDHPIVLLGVSAALAQQQDFEIVGCYTDSRALQAGLQTAAADVLVVDYSLSKTDLDGAALMHMLTQRFPQMRLLAYSSHYDAGTVAHALRSGARGFVGKSMKTQQLAIAIRAVASGDIYLDAEISLLMIETTSRIKQSSKTLPPVADDDTESIIRNAKLSPREREVLSCFLNGMTISEIAEKFDRSVKTISTQKFTAYRKLGVSSDNGLFKIARLLGHL